MSFKNLYNGFLPGASLTVRGCVKDDANRFEINLQGGPITAPELVNDIILHVNPRFYEEEIVRNTFRNGFWGCAEREGGLFFSPGQEFTVIINCELKGFKITVDDCPFIYYKHRHDVNIITHAAVIGDVIVQQIDYTPPFVCQADDGLHNNVALVVPTKITFHNGFNVGSQLTVFGQVRNDFDRFSVNLVCGHHYEGSSVQPTNIALHFNPRFDENLVVMNSMRDGCWENEEREDLTFSQGENISLCISCDVDALKISVNDTVYAQFSHRMDPHNITYVYICGGVTLHNISQ